MHKKSNFDSKQDVDQKKKHCNQKMDLTLVSLKLKRIDEKIVGKKIEEKLSLRTEFGTGMEKINWQICMPNGQSRTTITMGTKSFTRTALEHGIPPCLTKRPQW